MHRSAILIAVAATMMIATEANAQSRAATYNACESLSLKRGSGPGPSTRTHNEFMRECLAGKIPFSAGRAFAAAPEAHVQSFERCEALSEQRGAGPGGGSGNRNHNSFMRQCMAGKIR